MKVIVAGSREHPNKDLIFQTLNHTKKIISISQIVSGKARGVDTYGEEWAKKYGYPIAEFSAHWHAHGKAAGPIRNAQMAQFGDILLAFPFGEAKGTRNMISQMIKLEKRVVVIF